jgi:hypothetical protein
VALALHRAGYEVAVLERRPELSEVGAGIGLPRGPHEPAALTAWLRPACERVLLAQPGVAGPSPAG